MIGTEYANDLTIVMPYWNTEKRLFNNSMSKVLNLNVPIIIVNDGCDREYREDLFKYESNPLVTIIDEAVNKGQPTATYIGACAVTTKYVIRVDSDDLLFELPYCPETDDFDSLHISKKTPTNLYQYLLKGGSPNGSVFKTELFIKMYSDHEFISKYKRWLHEDTYSLFKMYIEFPDTKILHSTNSYIYKRVFRDVPTESTNKVAKRINARFEMFRVYLMLKTDKKIEDYLMYDIPIRGYNESLKDNTLSSKLINESIDKYEEVTGKKSLTKRV